MPDLLASLLPHDLAHLRILAELWGLELDARERDSAADELAAFLLDPELVRETMEVLSAEARATLTSLVETDGRMEWVAFARRFGEIREMGAGKRDRERPHRNPACAAEVLYYRGLLAKAFFETDKGAQEFAYIPDDLLLILKHEVHQVNEEKTLETLGRPATPVEKAYEMLSTDRVLDDATTLLAALRVGKADWQSAPQLTVLLQTAKLLKKNIPQAEAVKKFLEAARADALSMLIEAWKSSTTFDELRLLPSILCEGEWKNSPRDTRHTLLGFLRAIPQNQWWSLPAFLRDLKTRHPDFQRPAGDYDSWFIKRAADGQYLRGFAYWDAVDGALVRSFIQTLHWLGMADLAAPEDGKDFTAFRVMQYATRNTQHTTGKIAISSNGKISVSRFVSRAVRYQIARFCDWDDEKPDGYQYRVTAQSLKLAQEQGLKAEQLLSLLVKHTKSNVPPALVKALKRWEVNGTEARTETLAVLRVSRPEVLEELRASKAGRFLGEPLGSTAVIVKREAIPKIAAALAEMGLLLDIIEAPAL